ncbi:MAG: sulfatase-like hydrolase/transferase [Leptospiraceae bacterium]|nr:sulfatase-like hydrolase/transferase [Leptospiraceae bacterium]
MKKPFQRLPASIKYHLYIIIAALCSLGVYRLVFYNMYAYRIHHTAAAVVSRAFLVGLRFDIMVTALVFGPFLLLACVHFLNRWRVYTVIWRVLPVVFYILLLVLLGADLVYYENGNKHLGYEAYAYLNPEMLPIAKAALNQNPFLFVIAFLGLALLAYGIYRLLKKIPYQYQVLGWRVSAVYGLLFLALVFLAARGGWQQSPLRTGDAIIANESIVNDLAINPVFTVMTDLKVTRIAKQHRMDTARATAIVQHEIDYPGAAFVDPRYPILRKLEVAGQSRLPNIVIIILEGCSGKFIKNIGQAQVDGIEVAPHFNRLQTQGTFFTHMFAAGGRTTNGLMAIISGIPDRPGLTAVRTPQIMNRFGGLGNILKTLGYQTLFVTGNDLNFNNKSRIMKHWGFDRRLGKIEIDALGKYTPGPWSHHDENTYAVFLQEMLQFDQKKPILAAIHTGSTHYPYKVPDPKFAVFSEKTRDHAYLNVYHYADYALDQFLGQARQAGLFENTIFFILSDHSHHRYLNYYEDRSIPFLIYAPGRIPAAMRPDIVSQLDIMPTILGLVNRPVYFASMGRDLLRRKGGSAYFAYGNLFGWIDARNFYFQMVTGTDLGRGMTVESPYEETDLCTTAIASCQNYYDKSKAFLNLGYEMLNRNRIFPDALPK